MMTPKQRLAGAAISILPLRAQVALANRFPRFRWILSETLPSGVDVELPYYLGRYRVFLNTGFPVERYMVSGGFDPTTIDIFSDHVRTGDVCVDIGANVGALTLALARACSPDGEVIAYEPGPSNFDKLRRNILANAAALPKVKLFGLGIADEPAHWSWCEDPANRGNGTLRKTDGESRVEVTTLDQHLLPLLGERRVSFIKIDAEGMEFQVLKGAVGLVERHHPRIYFETHPDWIRILGPDRFRAMETWLTRQGYVLYRVAQGGGLSPTDILHSSENTLAIHRRDVVFPERYPARSLTPSRPTPGCLVTAVGRAHAPGVTRRCSS